MRHKNRTASGDRKTAEHQARYEKWWLGKIIKTSRVENAIQEVVGVKYHGNSVYGPVELTLKDGSTYFPYFDGFRPKKSDVTVLERIEG